MESNGFRKLLLILALLIIIPVIDALYGMMTALVCGIIVIAAIIIIFLYFATKSETKAVSQGISADINSINIEANGRSYIISEGDYFNTDDYNIPGIMSYIENGTWFISDNPDETSPGAIAEITIPHGFKLNTLTVKVVSGNILIKSAEAEKTLISVIDGVGQFKHIETSSLTASVGKGELLINTALNGSAQLECGSGKLDISLEAAEKDFNLDAVTGSGAICINNETVFNSQNRTGKTDNASLNTIKARCGLGQLNINFTEVADDEQN